MKLPMNFWRRKVSILILLIVVSTSAFLAGVLAHRYGIHYKIPGIKYIIHLSKAREGAEPPLFYIAPRQEPPEIFRKTDIKYPFTFIVYGDSREPAGYEKDALITRVVRENPSFVLHLGDMVFWGEEHQWKIFDLFDGRIMENDIPFYPVLGNHEYNTRKEYHPPNPEQQLQHYFNRFPSLGNRRWYSFKYGNSLFLILDTNTDYSPRSYQHKWLINRLKEESPKFLFVAFHHSPYTRSKYKTIRKSERFLADTFEGYADRGFIKADIIFSSHVHNYERYKHNDINYVVSGGGGSPQHVIERAPNDFYAKSGETFHYCKVTISETKAVFEMIRLDKNTGKWVVADTFTIFK